LPCNPLALKREERERNNNVDKGIRAAAAAYNGMKDRCALLYLKKMYYHEHNLSPLSLSYIFRYGTTSDACSCVCDSFSVMRVMYMKLDLLHIMYKNSSPFFVIREEGCVCREGALDTHTHTHETRPHINHHK
jgi:hypothetical protein